MTNKLQCTVPNINPDLVLQLIYKQIFKYQDQTIIIAYFKNPSSTYTKSLFSSSLFFKQMSLLGWEQKYIF